MTNLNKTSFIAHTAYKKYTYHKTGTLNQVEYVKETANNVHCNAFQWNCMPQRANVDLCTTIYAMDD